jgi:DNA-directed RNA polymerase subunit K/omega
MFKVSTEELVEQFTNRYEAVVVLAKEARRTNIYAGEELREKGIKPILNAIQKLTDDGIAFEYVEEEQEEATVEETKAAKTKKEKKAS